MKVLVTAASKHGSTAEIANAIGAQLASRGVETDVRPPDEVTTLLPYDGVVLGRDVYPGRWLRDANELAEQEPPPLSSVLFWHLSNRPFGRDSRPLLRPAYRPP